MAMARKVALLPLVLLLLAAALPHAAHAQLNCHVTKLVHLEPEEHMEEGGGEHEEGEHAEHEGEEHDEHEGEEHDEHEEGGEHLAPLVFETEASTGGLYVRCVSVEFHLENKHEMHEDHRLLRAEEGEEELLVKHIAGVNVVSIGLLAADDDSTCDSAATKAAVQAHVQAMLEGEPAEVEVEVEGVESCCTTSLCNKATPVVLSISHVEEEGGHAGHDEGGHAHEGGHTHGNRPGANDFTLHLRVVAIFVIMVSGMIGGIPPLYAKIFKDLGNPVARMLRAASAGIIVSLALVHILPHAHEEFHELALLAGLDPYFNVTGCAVIFGVMLMMVIEGVVHSYRESHSPPASALGSLEMRDSQDNELKKPLEHQDLEARGAVPPVDHHCNGAPHHHQHIAGGAMAAVGSHRQQTLAYMFEFGCLVHSVIIGISLGVIDKDYPQVRNVMIALCFHQLLEGIGLGAFISVANFGLLKGWLMVITYSLTAPLGVAVGIGVAYGYEFESVAATATQGTLNALSAGILLYMGLVQMVAIEFSPEGLALLRHWSARVGMYAAFFVGAACMSFLAIWA